MAGNEDINASKWKEFEWGDGGTGTLSLKEIALFYTIQTCLFAYYLSCTVIKYLI